MGEKTKIDENIAIRHPKSVGIDPKLPFRIQKRRLFEKLGFPIDKELIAMPVTDLKKIQETLFAFLEKDIDFLIITSLKPMMTWIPPLFRISKGENCAVYRDAYNNIETISTSQIITKIQYLAPLSWLEFARYIWGGETFAGRLLYVSAKEQLLEIQKGVEIPDIDKNPIASFRTQLSYFEPDRLRNRRLTSRSELNMYDIREIIRSLGKCILGFEGLKAISKLPTLEFAYTKKDGLIIIDVDWPDQYLV